MSENSFHGVLIVDKPGLAQSNDDAYLLTSHDVVQRVRRWSGQRRIGHTGTLDPMASGVLVLCMGVATRLVEYYQGHPKEYYAEVALGTATDTYDATGQIVTQTCPPSLTPAHIEEAFAQFRGEIEQVPPVYSALKRGGESMHRKARRGEHVELEPRTVTFYRLELLDYHSPDRICLRARCSAGTYIRSLAHDLGEVLGIPAHLSRLRREAAGPFTLDHAHTLVEIEQAGERSTMDDLLLPLGFGLDMPRICLGWEEAQRFGYGQQVVLNRCLDIESHQEPLAQAILPDGSFAGILRCLNCVDQGAPYKAEKWFVK